MSSISVKGNILPVKDFQSTNLPMTAAKYTIHLIWGIRMATDLIIHVSRLENSQAENK